MFTMLFSEYFS